ncbi:MAG: ABC transporter permease subunit [Bdellovibrionales bacterium]|nr:ABC transporter permease subunit [Bdellovibrionales bacterium]
MTCFASTTAFANIVIGSKNFSESFILGEMLGLILEERYHQPVVRKLGLGGTQVALDALIHDNIHVYPDYTGTGYVMVLKKEKERDPDKIFDIVQKEFQKKWNIQWSEPLGFNNTYALAVRKEDSRFDGIAKISQLSGEKLPYVYAGAYEYMERKDGHSQFVQKYNLKFDPSNVISMNAGLMYSSIRDKKVDMVVAYSTDGRIQAYNLRLLEDDLQFFPPYYVSYLAKSKTLLKFPQLEEAIELLEGQISEKEMIRLNDQVDRLKKEPKEVARIFLEEKGLLKVSANKPLPTKSFSSYIIKRKNYLIKLFWEHCTLSFGALLLALIFSIPLGIAMTRFPVLGRIGFPVVNTIQTIPSLALLGFLIPVLGIGFAPAILALFLYSLLPLVRNTYTGILNVDPLFIEVSKGVGLTPLQILWKVEIPLALPVILAGLRTAAVIVIGTATLAALIGAGGFGDPIFRGVATVNSHLILLGAIPAALFAIVVDQLIGFAERYFVSKGIQLSMRANSK